VGAPAHAFYDRLNEILDRLHFDRNVEHLCRRYYKGPLGRPSIAPGVYFRTLLLGYFEGIESERGIAWRLVDSLSMRRFIAYALTEETPDHSSISRTRRLFAVETHTAVFRWVLKILAEESLVEGKTVSIDATTLEANAALRSLVRRAAQAGVRSSPHRRAAGGQFHRHPAVPRRRAALFLPLPIAGQRGQAQPMLPAKLHAAQPAGFVFGYQLLDFRATPASLNYHHMRLFVHPSSASPPAAPGQMGCSDSYSPNSFGQESWPRKSTETSPHPPCRHDPPRSPLVLLGLSVSSPPSGMNRWPWCAQFLDSCLSQARNAHRESPRAPAMLASPSFHDVLKMSPHSVAESLPLLNSACVTPIQGV
jgi:transposase